MTDTEISDKEWLRLNKLNHRIRVFRRGDRRMTSTQLRERIPLSKQTALVRLHQWERGEISWEQLHREPKEYVPKKKIKPRRRLPDRPRSEELERIPLPSKLERKLFG